MDRYHHSNSDIEVHWLSILNSFVLVLLLTLFLSIVLVRILKNDFTRYMGSPDDVDLEDDETGWKLIHSDVFRYPKSKMMLSSCVGAGTQILATVVLVVGSALMDLFDPVKRGNVLSAMILTHALTSALGGYVSARLYRQLDGTQWVRNILLTTFLVPAPTSIVIGFLNSVALHYGSTRALPASTVMILLTLFACVTFPLTVVGGIAGKNSTGKYDAPCKTNLAPRELPRWPWHRSQFVRVLISGTIVFSAIYIELHYIVESIWGHKLYTLFGILAIALTMVILVTSFVSVAFTYFLLIGEDYRWWWRSFFAAGSTGVLVFAYCFYFFFQKTQMEGMLQTSFYFGYMWIVAYMFSLALGSLGFHSSFFFVSYIYGAIKSE